MRLSTFFLVLMYTLNIASVISIVFIRRYDTGVTFAWLLVFLFLPYIGLVLYFFFGSTYRMRVMSRRYGMNEIEERYSRDLHSHIQDMGGDKIQFNEQETEKYRDMIILNTKNAMSYYTEDNNVELLINASEKFSRMFEDIEKATESIYALYFIIRAKDEIGKKFISLLAAKAREGIEVKLIYDGIGCLETHMSDFNELKQAGGKVYRFLPSMLSSFLHINYRMHRKMVIIDRQIAYTGGINVGDEYFGTGCKKTLWRDTSIRLTGTSVLALQMRFLADLVFLQNQSSRNINTREISDKEQLKELCSKSIEIGKVGVQILSSGPSGNCEVIKDAYVKMITSAKKYLYIQSPYFVPDKTILDSLRLSAASGVDVRIMVPGVPDKKYVYYVTLSYLEDLLNAGIKVYLHSGFIHAKTLVIDNHVSTVGTTNVDIRSFRLDYEVNAFIYNTDFAKKCRDTFFNDIKDCKQLDIETYCKRRLWYRMCESVCRLIAPLA